MSAVISTPANPQASAVGQAAPDDARRLVLGAPGRAIAVDGHGAIGADRFERQVRALAAQLPPGRHAINLCEDRYRFLVAFCAVAVRGQVNLLPPSRAPALVADVLQQHTDGYCLGDEALAPAPPRYWRLPATLPELEGPPLRIDPQALAAIGFTSGSTGRPSASPKTWASFQASTAQNLAVLRDLWPASASATLVATVPPQHMYGMELSVLLPLRADVTVHAARPFFPADVVQVLGAVAAPRLLVTTPVHLRALLEAGIALPPLAGIVSATAPLSAALAARAERLAGCEVRELFGSTETCVIAWRRTARSSAWTPMPGVALQPQPDGTLVHAPQLAAPALLADLVAVRDDGRFDLQGRSADLLEIAGKRASLGDLTRRLQAVPGVLDAVVFQTEDPCEAGVRRIAALAVAPGLAPEDILQCLRGSIDPVFLPRPLRCVAALPRNATGKLPYAAIQALLRDSSG